jgi:diadenosine tetraphosphate (Ap4A) HIT family hydrolase
MQYNKNNVFAKILRHEIPCNKVYEDDFCLAFNDLHPASPIHVLVIPKGEYKTFDDFCLNGTQNEVSGFFKGVTATLEALELVGPNKNGYRLITNCGPHADQTVHHFHVHILAGISLGNIVSHNVE